MEPVICEVLRHYSVWSGSIETAHIKAQQRRADQDVVPPKRTVRLSLTFRVEAFLLDHPGWWTVRQVGEALQVTHVGMRDTLKHLATKGRIERLHVDTGRRPAPVQKYRKVAR